MLLTSDVSARGMDYPDVTHVCQVGLTEKEQYVHRVGRTARAGKSGEGMLIVTDFEAPSMQKLLMGPSHNTMGMTKGAAPAATSIKMADATTFLEHPTVNPPLRELLATLFREIGEGAGAGGAGSSSAGGARGDDGAWAGSELYKSACQCYQAHLGFYNGHCKQLGWSKPQLVQMANQFIADVGIKTPPSLMKKTVGMMGLKGVPGLRVA